MKDEIYLQITVHDSAFYDEFKMLGAYLEKLILDYDIDLISIGDRFDDEYILNICKDVFLNTYKIIRYDDKRENRENEIGRVSEYLDKRFSIKFITQSEIEDYNYEYLYIQLTGYNKGYYFVC